MANIIRKDKEWLREEIESGVHGFLEMNLENLCEAITKDIYKQLFLSACAANIESDDDGSSKLVIRIDIPDPDLCAEAINTLNFDLLNNYL